MATPRPARHPMDQTITAACAAGRHVTHRRRVIVEDGIARSRCRICGVPLVRTLMSRRWYPSAMLGGPAAATVTGRGGPFLQTTP